jgi:hypothetical protein
LAIVVIKGTDYPKYMKNRRKDKSILRYLPFNELEDVDTNLDSTDDRITKRLKSHSLLYERLFLCQINFFLYFHRGTTC